MRLHVPHQVSWKRRGFAIAATLVVWGNPAVVFADQASDVAALEATNQYISKFTLVM